MARYTTTQTTGWGADTAFAWMADLRHLADWDPSIRSSEQVVGDGPGVGSEYDVTVHAAGGDRTMRYRIEEWDPSAHRLLAAGEAEASTRSTGAIAPHDAECAPWARISAPMSMSTWHTGRHVRSVPAPGPGVTGH